MATCKRKFGHALQEPCGDVLVPIAEGKVKVFICLGCHQMTVACKECGGNLRRSMSKSTVLTCSSCNIEMVLAEPVLV